MYYYFKNILYLICLTGLFFSQTTIGAKFLLIPVGARANALGNAQVTNSKDVFASYWNPAGLAFQNEPAIGLVYFKWFPNLSNDMYYNFIGFTYPTTKFGTIGGHTIHLNLGKQKQMGESIDIELGEFYSYMNSTVVSYAYSIKNKVAFGVNIRKITQHLSDADADNISGNGETENTSFG